MSALDLDALQKLADEATPGPWNHWRRGTVLLGPAGATVRVSAGFADDGRPVMQERLDAYFIAAARTAIPVLIARVRELEAGMESALDCCARSACGATLRALADTQRTDTKQETTP